VSHDDPARGACNPWITDASGSHVATFANVGQLVTWIATGVGTSYSWSGDGVVGSPTGSTYPVRYSTIGSKKVSLSISGATAVPCYTATNGLLNGLPVINDPNFQPF
jgi:hypothetical protein